MKHGFEKLTKDRQWKATTGISQRKFEMLSQHFGQVYREIFGKTLPARQMEGAGNAHFHTIEDMLFFVLFSIKTGLTGDALGFVFDMDGSNASRNKQISLRILQVTLSNLGMLPPRDFHSVKDFEDYCRATGVEFFENLSMQIDKHSGKG